MPADKNLNIIFDVNLITLTRNLPPTTALFEVSKSILSQYHLELRVHSGKFIITA